MVKPIMFVVAGGGTPRDRVRTVTRRPRVERLAVLAALLLAACAAPVTVKIGDWTANCQAVPADDCEGIAGLFINNLAWSGATVLNESGGRVSVEPRPMCPAVQKWADPSFCWQATAKVSTGTAAWSSPGSWMPRRRGRDSVKWAVST